MVIVMPLTMIGVFAPLAYDFLEFKRAQGYKYESGEKVLQSFCKFSENYPLLEVMLTRELVSDWTASREGEAKKSRMHRITCINQFGCYLRQIGYEACTIPPHKRWDSGVFTPYIFTHDEIITLNDGSSLVNTQLAT